MNDQAKKQLTGIILAGGMSRRMGADKGLVLFKGKPLIQYSIDVFSAICSEILISSKSGEYANLGYKVVPDIYPGIGPMGGLYSCLKNSANEINLVLSCDMPFVTVDIFDHLIAVRGNAQVCIPWYENEKYEPLCGVYTKAILKEMDVFIRNNNYKLPDLFQYISFLPVRISEINPPLSSHYFLSINSPSDLVIASQLFSAK